MKPFLFLLLFGVLGAIAADVQRPNVVFILADDFGYADLACYGHPYAHTPALDGLAKDGTRFTQFYSTGVTCNPSRTGFMTGKFPATFAVYPANAGFGERVTISELLKKRGYRTGHFGKWHIGPTDAAGTYGFDATPSAPGAESKVASPVAIRDGAWKFHEALRRRGEPQLYDLAADPGETRNIAAARTDIAKLLQARIDAWKATLPKEYLKTEDDEN